MTTETPKTRLERAVEAAKALGPLALYFGCWNQTGHYLHRPGGMTMRRAERPGLGLPWDDALMDCGLLRNGKRPDAYDGRVFWTCGGLPAFWFAFFWWDRSVDRRGASNSGFYVRGFGLAEIQEAFDYACGQFPHVVARQRQPLVLQGVERALREAPP